MRSRRGLEIRRRWGKERQTFLTGRRRRRKLFRRICKAYLSNWGLKLCSLRVETVMMPPAFYGGKCANQLSSTCIPYPARLYKNCLSCREVVAIFTSKAGFSTVQDAFSRGQRKEGRKKGSLSRTNTEIGRRDKRDRKMEADGGSCVRHGADS